MKHGYLYAFVSIILISVIPLTPADMNIAIAVRNYYKRMIGKRVLWVLKFKNTPHVGRIVNVHFCIRSMHVGLRVWIACFTKPASSDTIEVDKHLSALHRRFNVKLIRRVPVEQTPPVGITFQPGSSSLMLGKSVCASTAHA